MKVLKVFITVVAEIR